jgi:uncharacterized protein (DUF885 family)
MPPVPTRSSVVSLAPPAAAALLLALLLPAPARGGAFAPVSAGAKKGAAARSPQGQEARFPGGIPEGVKGPDLAFYVIADRYLDEMMRAYPTAATVTGFHKHDGLLEDLTAEGLKSKAEMARRYRAELAAVDPKRLSAGARIDYELVLADIDFAIFALTRLRSYDWDAQVYVDTLGNATLYLTLQDPKSEVWPERLQALLSRMKQIPRFLDAARKNLTNPPPVITDLVIQTNAGNIAFFESTAPPLFDLAPAIKGQLEQENVRVIAALKEFQAWIEKDLRPRSKGDWRLGKDLWTAKLRLTLQSSMTPEEIIRRAQEKLDADRHRMLKVATPLHDRYFPDHQHQEVGDARINAIVGEVLGEVTKHHSTRETLFGDARKAVQRVKKFIREKNIITLPPDDDYFVVEPTPGFMDGVAVAFFNPPPVLEPDLKKSFWISSVPRGGTPEKDHEVEESFFREYNEYALQGLTIHEAFPGHYVQYWHALRSPIATVYKKIFSSGTFAEGWAVLAEKIMFDSGYGDGEPENLLVHIKQGLRVPINAILDARMHTTPMSEEEVDRWAMDLMRTMGFQEEAEARGKLRRAKISSTQLSTYFVGFYELSDILARARKNAGPGFDLRAFNDRLLSFGTIPPRNVRELLEAPAPRASSSAVRP